MFNDISRKCITANNTEFYAMTSNLEFSNHDYEQFHGIPGNLECANFADTSSSMELHGIPWNLESAYFNGAIFVHASSSMELLECQFRWHEQFPEIPWNLGCANFAQTSSPMEFHESWNAPISLTRAVPWNSMKLWVRQFRWHEQFHEILWNLWCANFADTSRSMEFRGISWNLECVKFADTSSSMEITKKTYFSLNEHGTQSVGDLKKLTRVYFNAYMYYIYINIYVWTNQSDNILWCTNLHKRLLAITL